MKKITTFVSVIAVAAVLTSCSITMPMAISEAPIGNKVGTSKTVVLFGGLELNRNFGIAQAAHNVGIKGGVGVADIKYSQFILFSTKEIIVHGN